MNGTPIESTAGRVRTYREDDAPVGDGSPEVRRLGAHWAVQERLERRRHGGQAEMRPAGRRRASEDAESVDRGGRRLARHDSAE